MEGMPTGAESGMPPKDLLFALRCTPDSGSAPGATTFGLGTYVGSSV